MIAKGASRWIIGAAAVKIFDDSKTLDRSSKARLDEYLVGQYLKPKQNQNDPSIRNDVPFSALTTWYLSGLDHEAHGKGMDIYKDFFMGSTLFPESIDNHIKDIVDRLKELDEFDDKIFIITADHGMTAMHYNFTTIRINPETQTPVPIHPEASCKLKLEDFDEFIPQASEGANNNLHIFEWAEMMKELQKANTALGYRVLAPSKIADIVPHRWCKK